MKILFLLIKYLIVSICDFYNILKKPPLEDLLDIVRSGTRAFLY